MPLIIDGNNLLHAPMPRRFEGIGVMGLCELLARSPWRNDSILLVCDGQPGPLGFLESDFSNVELIYSGHHQQADDVIEHKIKTSASPRSWIVITDDRQIQVEVKSHGARIMACSELLARLDAWEKQFSPRSDPNEKTPNRNANLSQEEVEKWLREFGES